MENPRLETVENQEVIELEDGVRLRLPAPTEIPKGFRYEPAGDFLLEKCQAAWSSSGEHDLPLNFRLVGQPGVGKNALVYELARQRKQPLYIVLGNEEFTAEDLVVSAAIHDNQRVEYIASTLLAAMIAGGICFIDEIAKMRPRSQAPLASLTDDRRTIYSALLARWFKAKPSFRFCAAYNPTDADSFDLAPWLKSRTLPEFEVKRAELGGPGKDCNLSESRVAPNGSRHNS